MTDIKARRYSIISFGCQMNLADTERLAGQLDAMGYTSAEQLEEADLILINTCCVRESAERKIYGKIGELKRLKQANPDVIIGVCGCMVQKDREKLVEKAPHVDLIFGTHNLHELPELVRRVEECRSSVLAIAEEAGDYPPELPALRRGKVTAWVPVMYGCNNFCTYCIVPYVRGRERSRPPQDILREIQELSREGFKEVTLLGQNVNSYGKDRELSMDFADLVQAVDDIPGIERIRYMTSHPRDFSDKLIATIAASRHVCEHFHLPLQAGSDEILARMNRGYSTDDYARLVGKIRAAVPGASITTDIIVGFPGETAAHFAETLAFVNAIRFDAAYTFLYSPRSGTPAATMPGQVPTAEKKARLQQLMEVQNAVSLDINKRLEGQVLSVLVEGTSKNDPNRLMGRTRTNKIVLWEGSPDTVGQIINIKITYAQTWVLKGEPQ